MSSTKQEVLVIGGGIGGAAAALRAAQYNMRVTWVMGDRETARASRGRYVHEVDNMIGLHPGVMVSKVAELLEDHPEARSLVENAEFTIGTQDVIDNVAQRLESEFPDNAIMVRERAVSARKEGDEFVVELAGGDTLRGDACVLSTGVMDEQPQVKKTLKSGREMDGIKWIFPYANFGRLLYCIRCEGHMTRGTQTVVIGSSETTAQIAMMLHERYGVQVVVLTNGEDFQATEESRALLDLYRARVLTDRVVDIYDVPAGGDPKDRQGKKGTEMHGVVLESGEQVPARFAMVAMGLYRVYNDLALELGAELEEVEQPVERRHVLVEDYSAETSVRGLFSVGDMAKRRDSGPLMKQIYTAQEYGVRAIDTIERRKRSQGRQLLRARD